MITISVESGFVIYLVLMLGGLCALAVEERWRRRIQHWSVSEEKLGQCEECSYTFVIRRTEKVARCPRCRTLCSARQK